MIQNWEPYDLKGRHDIFEAAYLLAEEDPPADYKRRELAPKVEVYLVDILVSIIKCLIYLKNPEDKSPPVAFMDEVTRILKIPDATGEIIDPLSNDDIERLRHGLAIWGDDVAGLGRASELVAKLPYVSHYFVPLKSEYRVWCESKRIMSKAFIPECRAEQNNVTTPEKETGAGFALPPGTRWSSVAIRVSHLRMTVDVARKRHCSLNTNDIPAFADSRQKGMTQTPLWEIFEGWVDEDTVHQPHPNTFRK